MKHRPHHACFWSAREVVTRNMSYVAPTTTALPLTCGIIKKPLAASAQRTRNTFK
ncbi:hypothetical protein MyNCGM683_49430 [Achromobacter xylosoxidans]